MILNNVTGIAVRISAICSIRKIVYRPDSPSLSYRIEIRYNISGSTMEHTYTYGTDKDERDADFDRLNSAMDALDGIQQ